MALMQAAGGGVFGVTRGSRFHQCRFLAYTLVKEEQTKPKLSRRKGTIKITEIDGRDGGRTTEKNQ